MPEPRELKYRTVELRAETEGPGLAGYAAHFWSVDSYISAMAKGSFKKTLKDRGDRIPVLFNHDRNVPIGRPTELKEDNIGLKFNAVISDGTTVGRDVMTLLRDGVPLGMSFAFWELRGRPATDDDPLDFSLMEHSPYGKISAEDVWITEEVKLQEISVVTFPANELATIDQIRSQAESERRDHLTLLNAIRDGSLTDEQESLAKQIVAAMEERAGAVNPVIDTPPVPLIARRNIDIDLVLAKARTYTRA